jgi:hypothetical protein
MKDRHNTPSPNAKAARACAPRRRNIETERTSGDDRDAGPRSSVERTPDRECDEIGPADGYGGSGPDQNRSQP